MCCAGISSFVIDIAILTSSAEQVIGAETTLKPVVVFLAPQRVGKQVSSKCVVVFGAVEVALTGGEEARVNDGAVG